MNLHKIRERAEILIMKVDDEIDNLKSQIAELKEKKAKMQQIIDFTEDAETVYLGLVDNVLDYELQGEYNDVDDEDEDEDEEDEEIDE